MRLSDRPRADDFGEDTSLPADRGGLAAELAARQLRLPAGHPSARPGGGDARLESGRVAGPADAGARRPDDDADWVGGRRVWPDDDADWVGGRRVWPDDDADWVGGRRVRPAEAAEWPGPDPHQLDLEPDRHGQPSGGEPGYGDGADLANGPDGAAEPDGELAVQPGYSPDPPDWAGWLPAGGTAAVHGSNPAEGPYRPWFADGGSAEPWFAAGPGDALDGPS
jgi:hypothetical protein